MRAIRPLAMYGKVAIIPARSTRLTCGELCYTELNPVRAHMVSTPEAYRWSSAGAHCGTAQPDLALDTGTIKRPAFLRGFKFCGEGASAWTASP